MRQLRDRLLTNTLPSIMQCLEEELALERPYDQNDDVLKDLQVELEKKLPAFMQRIFAGRQGEVS